MRGGGVRKERRGGEAEQMKLKELCLEEATAERMKAWEGAKVENQDKRGRSIRGEQLKKMRQLLEAERKSYVKQYRNKGHLGKRSETEGSERGRPKESKR